MVAVAVVRVLPRARVRARAHPRGLQRRQSRSSSAIMRRSSGASLNFRGSSRSASRRARRRCAVAVEPANHLPRARRRPRAHARLPLPRRGLRLRRSARRRRAGAPSFRRAAQSPVGALRWAHFRGRTGSPARRRRRRRTDAPRRQTDAPRRPALQLPHAVASRRARCTIGRVRVRTRRRRAPRGHPLPRPTPRRQQRRGQRRDPCRAHPRRTRGAAAGNFCGGGAAARGESSARRVGRRRRLGAALGAARACGRERARSWCRVRVLPARSPRVAARPAGSRTSRRRRTQLMPCCGHRRPRPCSSPRQCVRRRRPRRLQPHPRPRMRRTTARRSSTGSTCRPRRARTTARATQRISTRGSTSSRLSSRTRARLRARQWRRRREARPRHKTCTFLLINKLRKRAERAHSRRSHHLRGNRIACVGVLVSALYSICRAERV